MRGTAEHQASVRSAIAAGCDWQHDADFELHASGGFLRSSAATTLHAGDGLLLDLRLPGRVSLPLVAGVRWVRLDADAGPVGAWVDFHAPDDQERATIYGALRQFRDRGAAVEISALAQRRFCLRRLSPALDPRSVLYVGLAGRLEPRISELLAGEVDELLTEVGARCLGIALFLEADGFRPSPSESLEHIRRWLESLAKTAPVLGVLVGPSSVAMMQLSRIVREAGVADSLMRFDDREAALAAWTVLYEQLALLGGTS